MFEPAEVDASPPSESDLPEPEGLNQDLQPKEETQPPPASPSASDRSSREAGPSRDGSQGGPPPEAVPPDTLNGETPEPRTFDKPPEAEGLVGAESPQNEQPPEKTQEKPVEQVSTTAQTTPLKGETPVVLTPKDVEAPVGSNPLISTALELVRERRVARARLSKLPNVGTEREAV